MSIVVLPLNDSDGLQGGQMYYEQQQLLMSQPGFQDSQWLKWKVLRSGSRSIFGGVTELVTQLTDSRRKIREYCWQVVGLNGNHVFHLKFADQGEFENDESIWLEVLNSFRIVCGATTGPFWARVPESTITKEIHVDCSRFSELESQLSAFPSEVAYLVPVILELAQRPVEDLCDEESDVLLLETTIEAQFDSSSRLSRKKIMADQFAAIKNWSESTGQSSPELEHSLNAVMGFIIGEYLYG